MKQVVLVENPMDPATWETYEAEDVRTFLMERFSTFPDTGRIYHQHVSQDHDVTPSDAAGVDRLGDLPGPFMVVVYPGEPLTIIVATIAVIAGIAGALLLAPAIPITTVRNTQSTSPNNALSDRGNQARPNGRIPDIFGTVRSTPDLLAVPYKVFRDNKEIEVAYLCVGRGAYDVSDVRDDTTPANQIDGMSVRVYGPGTSPNSGSPQLSIGAAIDFPLVAAKRSNSVNGQTLEPSNYANLFGAMRFRSPNFVDLAEPSSKTFPDIVAPGDGVTLSSPEILKSGVTPVLETRNATFSNDLSRVTFTAFNPTTFLPVNAEFTITTASFEVFIPGSEVSGGGGGDPLIIGDAGPGTTYLYSVNGRYKVTAVTSTYVTITRPDGSPVGWTFIDTYLGGETAAQSADFNKYPANSFFNLSGSYSVSAASAYTLTLDDPASDNAAWSFVGDFPSDETSYVGTLASRTSDTIAGPFIVNAPTATKIYLNFVALSGLYKDDGENQIAAEVIVSTLVTPVNSSGTPIGAEVSYPITLTGSAIDRDSIGVTQEINLVFTGRVRVRVERNTPKDTEFEGQVVDEVKWRDLYAISPVSQTDFGNVTTVYATTLATEGALAVKDRKLNALVTRRLPQRVSGSTFTGSVATRRADAILSAICLDPYIGNRPTAQVDFDSFYDTMTEVTTYFGTGDAAEFCYTFDNPNLSFEETVNLVAKAVFSTAYRRGSLIKLSFERETEDSVLLFNHRNKEPGSETRTVSFGKANDYDGVAFEYVDPIDDALVTQYVPQGDSSAIRPLKVESIGVRNARQAHFHAWRTWNKLKYQNTFTEFTATQEAELVIPTERVLVSDNTRSDTWDGEVVSQSILSLRLSQPFEPGGALDHFIFLQLSDGSVQSIELASVDALDSQNVVLSAPPLIPLALDDDLYARATYMIQAASVARPSAFIVSEKDPQGNFMVNLKAVNYDVRYYANDTDYINDLID